MRLLIIEDDAEILAYLCKGLEEHSHTVDRSTQGKDGLFLATTNHYDVLIIDRMLPELDGLTIIRTLRSSGNNSPVMILSALGQVDDRVKGLRPIVGFPVVSPIVLAKPQS
jgi:two-component system, OmpR family, response regulator